MDYTERNNEREKFSQSRCSNCGGSHPTDKCFKPQQNLNIYEKPPYNPRNSNIKRNKHNGQKLNTCVRYGSEDNFTANCPKLDTSDKKIHWNMEKPKQIKENRREIRTSRQQKRGTEDIQIYGTYVYHCRKSYNKLWRYFTTDQ